GAEQFHPLLGGRSTAMNRYDSYLRGRPDTRVSLAALEIRLALLDERLHGFDDVAGAGADDLTAGLVLQCLLHGHGETVVEQRLGHRERDRRARRQLARPIVDQCIELTGGHDAVDEAHDE